MATGNPLIVLFLGEVGMGKSALIKALGKNGAKQAVAGDAPGGVTKDFYVYPLEVPGIETVYGIDCMGVGDKDSKLPMLVAGLETAMGTQLEQYGLGEHSKINTIVICSRIGGRVGLGAQVASSLVKMGIISHDQDALKSIILCGTMADEVSPKKVRSFREKTGPAVAEYLGGMPGAIVTTGLGKEEDPVSGKNNIADLLGALQKIDKSRRVVYHKPTAEHVVKVLEESTGYECVDKQQFIDEVETQRKEMEARLKEMEKKRKEEIARVQREQEAKRKAEIARVKREQEAARRRQQQAAEQRQREQEARRKRELAEAEKRHQAQTAALAQQIKVLESRPPQIIHHHHDDGGGCVIA